MNQKVMPQKPKKLINFSEMLNKQNQPLKNNITSEQEVELKIPKLISETVPLFNYAIIAYRLSEAQARFIYPKYKDETVNWDENKRMIMPDMPINLPFKEIIETNQFKSMVIYFLTNLKAGLRIYKGELVKTSDTSDLKDLDLVKNKITVHLKRHQGESSIEGTKLYIDFEQNTLYTLIDSTALCAYEFTKK